MFTNRNVSKPQLQISIDNHSIDETGHTKYLGVIIDSKLNWRNRIFDIIEKIVSRAELQRKIELFMV